MGSSAGDPHDLNPTAASLLGFLHDGPLTGWDLSQVAEASIGAFWSLSRSQVYRELSRMEEVGLVEARAPGSRDRKPYELTQEGRTAFRDWAAEPPRDENIRFPLLLAVALGRHVDDAVLAGHLAEHRERHERRLADYQQEWSAANASGQSDSYAMATLAFGIAYEQMVLDWFERLPELLGESFRTS